ncbi:4Fe-4S dicluster domain-containing protein [Adlercreutzia rubneri]
MSISTTALDRRSAVKIAAAASLLAAGGACIFMVDAAHAEDEGRAEGGRETGPYAGRVGFLVKPHNCLNCQACVEACRKFNKTPESRPARRHITKYEKDGEALFVSTSCMHCEEPACASVCPAGAIKKAEDGVVYVDKDRCIGCKYCYQACPFGVPTYSSAAMDKCDCCTLGGTRPGNAPRCAEACKFGALHFGTVDELLAQCPDAKVVEASTKLSFYLA